MTNSNIWDCFTPLQAEAVREMNDTNYRNAMATIQLYVLEGMDVNEAIDEVIGFII